MSVLNELCCVSVQSVPALDLSLKTHLCYAYLYTSCLISDHLINFIYFYLVLGKERKFDDKLSGLVT